MIGIKFFFLIRQISFICLHPFPGYFIRSGKKKALSSEKSFHFHSLCINNMTYVSPFLDSNSLKKITALRLLRRELRLGKFRFMMKDFESAT